VTEERIPPCVLEKMEVQLDDFMNAFKEITPTAMREIAVEVPVVHWVKWSWRRLKRN